MKKQNKKGFTLIEILVVMALAALLVGLGLPAISNARQSARNGDRMQSLENVRAAMKDLKIKFPRNNDNVCLEERNNVQGEIDIWIKADGNDCSDSEGRRGQRQVPIPEGKIVNSLDDTSCPSDGSQNNEIIVYNDPSSSTLVFCKEGGGEEVLKY